VPKAGQITDDMVRQVYSQDEIDEYGMDYWKSHMKASLFMQQSTPAKQNPPQRQPQNSIEDQFYVDLSGMVPDLADRNTDTAFLQWLQVYDLVSGQQYMTLLRDAEARHDSVSAATIFDLHKSSRSNPTQDDVPAAKAAHKGPSVQSQVAPSGMPVVSSTGPTMTLSEYTKRSGEIARMTPSQPVLAGKERAKLRAAMSEGRVVDDQTGKPVLIRAAG
jgi:hypothetical protein